jgi:hypothetical protein
MISSILISLISRYNALAFTHNYIMGFAYNDGIYVYNAVGLGAGIVLDEASSKCGGGYSLRYKPTKATKQALVESGECRLICSKDYFTEMVENSKYNKGEIFEKLITESYGQKWKKDNVPFFSGADLTANNIAYSIKFEKATICTEKTILRCESLKK